MEHQENYNITLNNKTINVAAINQLLLQGKRNDAIVYITYHTDVNKHNAQSIISNLEIDPDYYLNNPVTINSEERVVVRKENDALIATIYKANGTEKTIRNTEPAWVEVEELIGDNNYMADLGILPKQYTNWALKQNKAIAKEPIKSTSQPVNDIVEYNISHNTLATDTELLNFHAETKRVYTVITIIPSMVIISFIIMILWLGNNYTY